MKRRKSVSVAFVLLLGVVAVAQDTRKSGDTTNSSPPKTAVLTGTVSADGLSLASGKQEWSVRNADILSGYEGRQVTVKCLLYAEDPSMRVLAVKSVKSESRTYLSDSAFRR